MRGEVPCGEELGGLEERMEKRRKEQVGEQGLKSPHPLPSCLPGLFWVPQTLTTGVGKTPQPLCAGCGPNRPTWGQERWQGQMTPKARPTHLSKLRACWGAGQREEEEHMVNDPQVLPPVPATHPTWVGASPPRRPPRCWPASPAGLGRTGTAPGRSNRWPDRGAHSGGWGDVNGGPEGSRALVHALPLV